ncbi:hypothetical protein HBB16_18120 [Pseudonocardia sp. MCCB 268]|nr:hypothetical protein [Pseudonocardia cytotoxica]
MLRKRVNTSEDYLLSAQHAQLRTGLAHVGGERGRAGGARPGGGYRPVRSCRPFLCLAVSVACRSGLFMMPFYYRNRSTRSPATSGALQ